MPGITKVGLDRFQGTLDHQGQVLPSWRPTPTRSATRYTTFSSIARIERRLPHPLHPARPPEAPPPASRAADSCRGKFRVLARPPADAGDGAPIQHAAPADCAPGLHLLVPYSRQQLLALCRC
jgi:hypothetical protein